jgi:hypothetical protein
MGTTTNKHTTKTSPMLARRTAGRLQSGNTARVSGPSVDSEASGAMGTVWSGVAGKDRPVLGGPFLAS